MRGVGNELRQGRCQTQAELSAAKENLASWERRWENYSGNNPNKYRSDVKLAGARVASAEAALADFKRKGHPP